MKLKPLTIVGCCSLLAALLAGIVTAQPPVRDAQKAPAGATSKDIAAIRQSAAAFREAFNRGDAKAVAALWAKDGEYIDESGKRFDGRAAIEKEYTAFFAAHPGAKITVIVDAVRMLGDSAAIEDGHSSVEDAASGAAGYSKYTAVHVKADGKWSMSSVRETATEPHANAGQLRDIDWLVGSWTATENGATMEMDCRSVAGKSFLERTWSVKKGTQTITSGVQIIGFSSQSGGIQSWTFTSDGGHAVGMWSPRSAGWAIQTSGLLADGSVSTAVNVLTRLDDNSFSWRSVDRTLGGVSLPDGETFILKRATAKR